MLFFSGLVILLFGILKYKELLDFEHGYVILAVGSILVLFSIIRGIIRFFRTTGSDSSKVRDTRETDWYDYMPR